MPYITVINSDPEHIRELICDDFQQYTGYSAQGNEPLRLLLDWMVNWESIQREELNIKYNNTLPENAVGEALDIIGQALYLQGRGGGGGNHNALHHRRGASANGGNPQGHASDGGQHRFVFCYSGRGGHCAG